MIRKIIAQILVLIITLTLIQNNAFANIFDNTGYYDYEGSIGQNYKIMMSVYYDNGKVVGSYFYDKFRKEINVDGVIDGDKVTITEYDEHHIKSGIFSGVQKQNDSITGIWQNAKGSKKLNFKINLSSALPGCQYGHRYRGAGFDDDKQIEKYVEQFQNFVKKDDKINISNLLIYPINARVDGKLVIISSKKQFVNYYNKIFNPEFKNTMEKAYTKYMFANYQGVMFGSGMKNIWINYVIDKVRNSCIYITAINN